MKTIILFLILIFFKSFCFSQSEMKKSKRDFEKTPQVLIDSTIKNTEFAFTYITEREFLNAKKKAKHINFNKTKPDSSGLFTLQTQNYYYELMFNDTNNFNYSYVGYIPELSIHLIYFSGKEIREVYLLDDKTDLKFQLPSDFDQGPYDPLVSPLNNWLIVYSSFDSPYYAYYYSTRSEFIIYEIKKNQGIKGLSLFKYFETSDWSIDELIFINDNLIALKIYDGHKNESKFKYITTNLK